MNSRRSRPAALLLLALCISSSCASWTLASAAQSGASATGAAQDQSAGKVTTYLFPILRYGPNNQKRDLRQMIAIAKQLDCGLVLTGLYKHYRDTREPSAEAEKKTKGKSKFNGSTAAAALRALHAKQMPPMLRGGGKAAGEAPSTSGGSSGKQEASKGGKAGRLLRHVVGSGVADGGGHWSRNAGAWESSSGSSDSEPHSGCVTNGTRIQAGTVVGAGAGSQRLGSALATHKDSAAAAYHAQLRRARLPDAVVRQLRAIAARMGALAAAGLPPRGDEGASALQESSPRLRAAHSDVGAATATAVLTHTASRQLQASGGGGGISSSSNVAKALEPQAVKVVGKELELPRCFEFKYQHFLDFGNVLAAEPISDYVPVASIGELKAMGWDGVIDAFMFRQGHGPDENSNNQWHMTKTLRSTGVDIASSFVRLPVKVPVHCDPKTIADLKQRVQKFRVVALLLFTLDESEFPEYGKIMGPAPKVTDARSQCRQSLWQTERMLRPAPWIQQLASRYINESFGGSDFLAVHVRPFPDECLDVWKLPKLEEKHLKKHCSGNTMGLHHVLGPKIRDRLQGHPGIKQVFIMAHPAIRHNIDAVLAKDLGSGARLSYLDEHTLTRLAGCVDHSATFMSMAEEEVAVQADVFLGTAGSSITHSIVAERMGLQHTDITFIDQ